MTKRNPGPRAASGSSNDPAVTTPKKVSKEKSSGRSAKPGVKPGSRPTGASPSSAEHRDARIIAVANQKGGVGKSTTAVNLGAALTELGLRVLVVDLDPQGNASTGMGIKHGSRKVTVYDVLAAEAPVDKAIVPTSVDGLHAIPSTIDLAGAEIELVSQFSRELRLRKALEPLKSGEDGYDFIFLDCPPSLGLLTINALAAAEELLVPIQCEYYALEGLGQLLHNVRLVQQNINPALRLTGIIMTMFDSRTKLSEQVVEEVRRYFGDRVYDVIIPRTVRLSEAPGFGQPITVYDPKSRGADAYRALAHEVAERPKPEVEPMPVYDDMPRVILSQEETDSPVATSENERPTDSDGEPPPTIEAADGTAADESAAPPESPPRPQAEKPRPAPRSRARAQEQPRPVKSEADPEAPILAPTAPAEPRERPAPAPPPRVVPAPEATHAPTRKDRPGAPESLTGRRVVVIDERAQERAVMSGQEAGRGSEPSTPGVRDEGGTSEIGETLPQEPVKKKKWWQFGKGGEG